MKRNVNIKAEAVNPINKPIQTPSTPRLKLNASKYAIGKLIIQYATKVIIVGPLTSVNPRRTPMPTAWVPSES